ncbi:amino acid permease [Aristophania vespae]|uniref:Amino acid permease n=1 Tax=Aristophania vespae TaxID=2697033 RepID=A0A6P1NG87_9PROT|nr:amino acid permease [Aristophania vespae]QHI95494.1 amino acid permease [Aristophania vespae]UMM63068.1 putative amino acid permease YhdG [Aristophania vespae]
MKELFGRLKPLQSFASQDDTGLKRIFGPWHLIMLGVGVTVGSGLFSLTGVAAGQHAGPAVILSFIIAPIACGFSGLCYAELAGMISSGGAAYSYSYIALGEIAAWTVGWNLILEYTLAAATVASSWSGYLNSLLKGWGIFIDPRLTASTFTKVTLSDGSIAQAWFNLPTVVILFLVTLLLMRGMTQSSRINIVIVTIKVLVIASVLIVCFPHIKLSNYQPFIPPNSGEFGQFGISGVMRAAGMAFFAYLGFDVVCSTTADTKNPQRDIPIGVIGTLIACTIIYVVFAGVLVGVVNYHLMEHDANPVATAIDIAHMPWLATLVKLGVTLGYISVLYGILLGESRVGLSMAKDKLLPGFFGKVHQKSATPWNMHIISFVVSAILAGIFPISLLGNLTSIATLFSFIVVCICVLALRLRKPDITRSFKVPGGTFLIPILGIISCCAVMVSMDIGTWTRLFVWWVAGMIFYAFYGAKKSLLRRETLSGRK